MKTCLRFSIVDVVYGFLWGEGFGSALMLCVSGFIGVISR